MSQDIRLNMVKDLLEEEYYIYPLEVAPRDLGLQGVAGNRVYIFCAHKTKCRYLFSVYEAYTEICRSLKKYIHTEPGDYLVAVPSQIQFDALRVSACRHIQYEPETYSF